MTLNLTELTSLKSTEQSIPDKATPSPPQLCSTRQTEALPLDFSSIKSDPCMSESTAMCNNRSDTDILTYFCECAADGIWTIIQKRFDVGAPDVIGCMASFSSQYSQFKSHKNSPCNPSSCDKD